MLKICKHLLIIKSRVCPQLFDMLGWAKVIMSLNVLFLSILGIVCMDLEKSHNDFIDINDNDINWSQWIHITERRPLKSVKKLVLGFWDHIKLVIKLCQGLLSGESKVSSGIVFHSGILILNKGLSLVQVLPLSHSCIHLTALLGGLVKATTAHYSCLTSKYSGQNSLGSWVLLRGQGNCRELLFFKVILQL